MKMNLVFCVLLIVLCVYNIPSINCAAATLGTNTITSGQTVPQETLICSPNGNFCFKQADEGQIVQLDMTATPVAKTILAAGNKIVKASNGALQGPFTITMKKNGDLQTLDVNNNLVWNSNTNTAGSVVKINNNGNVVIQDPNGNNVMVLGSMLGTNKLAAGKSVAQEILLCSQNQNFCFKQADEGQIVKLDMTTTPITKTILAAGNKVVKASNGQLVGPFTLTMQKTGDLQTLDATNQLVWNSNTNTAGSSVQIDNQGNVNIVDGNGVTVTPLPLNHVQANENESNVGTKNVNTDGANGVSPNNILHETWSLVVVILLAVFCGFFMGTTTFLWWKLRTNSNVMNNSSKGLAVN